MPVRLCDVVLNVLALVARDNDGEGGGMLAAALGGLHKSRARRGTLCS